MYDDKGEILGKNGINASLTDQQFASITECDKRFFTSSPSYSARI
jgi:hypothetical protein